jgi:hypothetical protein
MHDNATPGLLRRLVIKFSLILGLIVIIVNTLVISFVLHIPSQHYSIIIISLNVTACLATIYGFVTIYRYGINSTHGKSLLFLTLGILSMVHSWFVASIWSFCSTLWGRTDPSCVFCGSMLDNWLGIFLITSLHRSKICATGSDPRI